MQLSSEFFEWCVDPGESSPRATPLSGLRGIQISGQPRISGEVSEVAFYGAAPTVSWRTVVQWPQRVGAPHGRPPSFADDKDRTYARWRPPFRREGGPDPRGPAKTWAAASCRSGADDEPRATDGRDIFEGAVTVDRWLSTVDKSRTCGQMARAAGGQRVGKQVLGWADEQASGPLTARLARSPRRYQWQAAAFCVMPIAGGFRHSGPGTRG